MPSEDATAGFPLVRAGRSDAVIVVAANATPSATLAALELQHHIEKIADAVAPIRNERDAPSDRPLILVGESEATRRLGLRSADFAPQEYLIRVEPWTLVLIGRDWLDTPENRRKAGCGTNYMTLADARHSIDYAAATGRHAHSDGGSDRIELPGLFDDQGTCAAVYDFLERFCGVRWYGPTDLNVVAPRRSVLTIPLGETRRSPAMKYREGIGGGWPILDDQWNHPTGDQLNLYWRRMRVGGERWGGNHSFRSYYDRFLRPNPDAPELFEEERPDYFAQGPTRGERQFCYTNPALVQQVARDAREYFDGKGIKGHPVAMGDAFAVVPMDNASWCECERCQAILATDRENRRGEHFSSGTATHYLFQFVNAVAREVRKTHPQKWISTLAYHVYAYRPTAFALEPNVIVAPCLQTRNYWAPRIKQNDLDLYRAWVEPRDRPIYVWNYYCFPMEPALIGKWRCFPGFNIHSHAEDIRRYAEDGVRGVFLCGIGEQVDYYATMKLYDDPTQDVEALLTEFFSLYFGSAAKPMERFYRRIEETFSEPANYPNAVRDEERQFHQTEEIAWKCLGTDAVMDELGGAIAEAKRLVSPGVESERVASWERGVWEYMVAGKAAYESRRPLDR